MRKNNILRLFLISLIVVPIITSCGPNWEQIATQRDDLVARLVTESVRMEDSRAEVKDRSKDFPDYYTKAHESQLVAANEAIANIGSSTTGWLGDLNTAIEKRDKKTANDRLGKIQTALDAVSSYTNQILGPPGSTGQSLYDILDAKVMLLHDGYVKGDTRDLLQETKDLDTTALVSIQTAVPFLLCGTDTQMSFKDARSSYGSAVAGVKSAEQLIIDGDEPAASDALVNAYALFNSASGSITNAPTNHQLAVNAINEAESSKKLADAVLLMIWVDYWYELNTEHSYGVTDLNNANSLCLSENFVSADPYAVTAVTSANSAKAHFDKAVWWSTEVEEEEVYIPPADDDDDDSIDPWSYESEEDTTPNDDNSWEYESEDDNSWEYESDDSDSWEYESDDSDSWDYEYDDSDSWDSDYDDSSSWDSSLFARREEILQLIKPLFEWIKNE